MPIISNKVYAPDEYVAAWTGCHFIDTNTLSEVQRAINDYDELLAIGDGYSLMDANQSIDEDVVLVRLSTEEKYTVYEYRFLAADPEVFE